VFCGFLLSSGVANLLANSGTTLCYIYLPLSSYSLPKAQKQLILNFLSNVKKVNHAKFQTFSESKQYSPK